MQVVCRNKVFEVYEVSQAEEKGLNRTEGHVQGASNLPTIVAKFGEYGVK